MDELAAFLRARWDEEEQAALAVPVGRPTCAPPAHWSTGADPGGEKRWVLGTHEDIDARTPEAAEHIARHDPARTLAEVEAKRRILDHCADMLRPDSAWGGPTGPEDIDPGAWYVLRLLSLPYADHPDYRDEWRPA